MEQSSGQRVIERWVGPGIFFLTGLICLWVFDVTRAFECRQADRRCTLEVTRFLGLKQSRTEIPPAGIQRVFSRQHALEQGWTYRLYIATQPAPAPGTEIATHDDPAVIESHRENLARFLADAQAPDVTMRDAPNRLNRFVALAVLAFAVLLFAAARRRPAA